MIVPNSSNFKKKDPPNDFLRLFLHFREEYLSVYDIKTLSLDHEIQERKMRITEQTEAVTKLCKDLNYSAITGGEVNLWMGNIKRIVNLEGKYL